jgi:peptide/nickel transport system substrate-binding protein
MSDERHSGAASTVGPPPDEGLRVGRRAVLAAGAASVSLFGSGCVGQTQSMLDLDGPDQVSLTIKTMPADADRRATIVARRLAEHLDSVGVDARVVLQSREELYRDVLLNQSFDVYVARYPPAHDPDFVRGLLHSRFDPEPGWQNPFGYTDIELDELLDAQRTRTGPARAEVLRDVERVIARDRPFSVVVFPDEIRTARRDWVGGRASGGTFSPLQYLTVDPAADRRQSGGLSDTPTASDSSRSPRSDQPGLRATITDDRVSRNRNPLAIEFRTGGSTLELIYDSLGRRVDGEVRPWLAADWSWLPTEPGDGQRAELTLRGDLSWHDGTDLTASDVAFTYEFLADTSLGRLESPLPAPRFRDESSLVESVEVLSADHVEFRFRPANQRVARRAFTVPLLPEHVWRDRSGTADISGIQTGRGVTEALVWNNPEPVGSGPYRFERASTKESVVLSRFEGHPLERPAEAFPGAFGGEAGIPFETAAFLVVPSGGAAVELVRNDEADTTFSPLSAAAVPAIGRDPSLTFEVSRPNSFYHVGFNARRTPTSNTRFRRAVASLVDQAYVAEEVFEGYAVPSVSPFGRGDALSPDLEWTGSDPVLPFPGTDGRLDVARAREQFRAAGYRYGESGALLTR